MSLPSELGRVKGPTIGKTEYLEGLPMPIYDSLTIKAALRSGYLKTGADLLRDRQDSRWSSGRLRRGPHRLHRCDPKESCVT